MKFSVPTNFRGTLLKVMLPFVVLCSRWNWPPAMFASCLKPFAFSSAAVSASTLSASTISMNEVRALMALPVFASVFFTTIRPRFM